MNKRQLIHHALVVAKPYVSKTNRIGNKEQFICRALTRAKTERKACWGAVDLAIEMIMERITARHYCIEGWLNYWVGEAEIAEAERKDPNVIQQYRHRWLDALIEEFSKPA